MERTAPNTADRRARWEGWDALVRVEVSPDAQPVAPEVVLDAIEHTVREHGVDVGRTAFNGCFPGREELFDQRFRALIRPEDDVS